MSTPVEQAGTVHVPGFRVLYPGPLDAARSLLSIVVVALFVLTFIVQPFRIPSESMERTLLVGDFLLVNKAIYAPPGIWKWLLPYRPIREGAVVVFHFPLDPKEHVVKRVIGIPGDRIHLRQGVVYRNGAAVAEPYAVFERAYSDSFRDDFPGTAYNYPGADYHWWLEMRGDLRQGELVVPPGQYFVMGDNRNNSRDSRYWGFVPRSAIVGRPFLIYFSLRRPSSTDLQALPDDRLGQNKDWIGRLLDFARWYRVFHLVR